MKFYAWLMKNRWRGDRIGDIAREVHSDTTWPKRANSWKDVRAALPSSACDSACEALEAAWADYEQYVGGPSHLKKDLWVHGVTGVIGLTEPTE